MKIALIGYGKMGKEIEKVAVARGHEIVSIIDVDKQEMLGLFVSESRKDIDRLSAAGKEKDSREIISILHRNLPLWETVRLDYPVAVLRVLVKSDAGQWEDKEYVKIEKIIGAVRELISYAELMRKERQE